MRKIFYDMFILFSLKICLILELDKNDKKRQIKNISNKVHWKILWNFWEN